MKRTDIVIPYIIGPDNGLELRYALRSIAKNFNHTNYRVILVGDIPEWVTWVEKVPFKQVAPQKNRTFTDQLLKLYTVLTSIKVSPDFIWTYDDIYFTRTVTLEDIALQKAVAGFDKYPTHLELSGAGPNWKSTMSVTMEKVKENGGTNYNYETHLPRMFNTKTVLKLYDRFNLLGQPVMLSSLYFNTECKHIEPLCLFDHNPGIRFMVRSTFDVENMRKLMLKHQFTNNAPNTWSPVIQKVLGDLFEKCRFEK